jgi:adenylosuccinate synthase
VVTKLDVLDELAEIPVCVGYKLDGKKTAEIPPDAAGYGKLECIYRKVPGWGTSTRGVRRWEKLPAKARAYLTFLEKETGARLALVSSGPERDETILRQKL